MTNVPSPFQEPNDDIYIDLQLTLREYKYQLKAAQSDVDGKSQSCFLKL